VVKGSFVSGSAGPGVSAHTVTQSGSTRTLPLRLYLHRVLWGPNVPLYDNIIHSLDRCVGVGDHSRTLYTRIQCPHEITDDESQVPAGGRSL
jgi:hypothetical protein